MSEITDKQKNYPGVGSGQVLGPSVDENAPYAEQKSAGYPGVSGGPSSRGSVVEAVAPRALGMLERQKSMSSSRPDVSGGGRGVARWINRTLRDAETEAGRRLQRQKIAAVGDMLRHAANLWGVSRGASNQDIKSRALQNEARWQARDALEAQRQALADKNALAKSKAEADAAYKAGMLGQGAERNRLAWANYGLAQQKNARDNAAFPYEMAGKAANAEYKKQQARKAGVDADWAPRLNQAQLANRNASTAAHNAAAANSRARTRKTLSEMSGGGGKGSPLSYHSKWYGTLHRTQKGAFSGDQTSAMYEALAQKGYMPRVVSEGGVTQQQMTDAIAQTLAAGDGKSQHAAHFLVDNGYLSVEGADNRRHYDVAGREFARRKEKSGRLLSKQPKAGDMGGSKW